MKSRLIGLDLFRIFLAIIVFAFHSYMHWGCIYGIFQRFVTVGGGVMMTSFFVLSGFSLYYGYEERNVLDVKNLKEFYIKRAISILVLYYIFAFLFVLFQGTPELKNNLILLPVEVSVTQSTFSSLFAWTHNGGTWFVSCMMICYFIFPLLLHIVRQLSTKHRLSCLLILSCFLIYAPFVVSFFSITSLYANPFFRALEFLVGILLSSISGLLKKKCSFINSKKGIAVSILLMIVGISAIYVPLVNFSLDPNDYTLYEIVILPILIVILPQLTTIRQTRKKYESLIIYFSNASYAFFLSQLFIWHIMKKLAPLVKIGENNVAKIICSLIVCVCMAAFFHSVIEKPIQRALRERFLFR